MFVIILFILFLIFLISFILALRSLSELEVPKEVIQGIKQGKKPSKFWGVIIFLKGKTVHYSSLTPSSEEVASDSSSSNSSKSSLRIEE